MIFYKEKFRNIRKEKGLTLEELANKLDTVKQTVSNWEMGRCNPKQKIVGNIASALGVSCSEFTDLKDTEVSNSFSSPNIKHLLESFQILDKEDQIEILNIVLGKINKKIRKK